MNEKSMNTPSEEALQRARASGQEAGDRGRRLLSNPYPPNTNREEHDAWEEGWHDGVRNH